MPMPRTDVKNNPECAMPALLCYSRRGLAILLAVAVMLLAGCSGNNADPAGALDPAMPGQGVADNAPVAGGPDGGFPTGLPVDAYVDPAVIAARRGNALGEYRLNGADYQLASANTSIDAGKLTLDAREDQLSWAMYCFEENTEADAPFVFALELAQYIHAPIEIGIADYQSGAWHWVGMDRPGPVNYFGTPGNLEPVNPGGNLYVMVIAKAGGYAVVDGLTIYRESAVPPPVGLATGHDGIHPDRITLSWEDLSVTYPGLSYSEVVVERLIEGGEWTEITRVPSGTSTYEDIASEQNDLQFGEECSYRLRTVTAGETGVACPAEPGICQLRSVSHLSATSNTYPDLIRLLWDPVDGADGYQIEIQYEDEWRTLVELESGDADIY